MARLPDLPLNARQNVAFAELQPSLMTVPLRMHEAITGYVLWGIPTGDFLRALLANDLMQAVCRADDENLAHLLDWARLLFNGAPPACFGHPANVAAWIGSHGLANADQVAALGWDRSAPGAPVQHVPV